MTLLTFYTLFCLQMLQRVIIIGGDTIQHSNLIDSSCILNSCGARDERGIVTICEDAEVSNSDCSKPGSVTETPTSNSFQTFCEETDKGACSGDRNLNSSVEKRIERIDTHEKIRNTTVEKDSTNSFSSYSYEIRAQLSVMLQELISHRASVMWPTDNLISVEDTLYHVTIKADCTGEKVVYNENKYLPLRIYVNKHLNQMDSKSSVGEEHYRRKRYSPRYGKKFRRFREAEDHSHDHDNDDNQRQQNIQHNHIDEHDKETLQHVYGKKTYSEHETDFEEVGKMGQQDNGAIEHKLSNVNNPSNENMDDVIDEARMNAVNDDNTASGTGKDNEGQLDSGLVKNMLKELLQKLDQIEHDPKKSKSTSHGHCNIHGLWLSTVAGAAIELLPDNNGVINTKIIDLPQPPEGALINSQWTGTGMISKESPTTITIVFQEHISRNNDDSEEQPPRTAVFVGQCLVCENSPMLQGTWILFPNSQNCFPLSDKGNTPSSDIMYQIRRRRHL